MTKIFKIIKLVDKEGGLIREEFYNHLLNIDLELAEQFEKFIEIEVSCGISCFDEKDNIEDELKHISKIFYFAITLLRMGIELKKQRYKWSLLNIDFDIKTVIDDAFLLVGKKLQSKKDIIPKDFFSEKYFEDLIYSPRFKGHFQIVKSLSEKKAEENPLAGKLFFETYKNLTYN